ncbi:MAG: ABC transporter permease, partial [Acetobacteraceae bacterium]|nr:ABC transporter permease [Acetobacteraceae bacterium]
MNRYRRAGIALVAPALLLVGLGLLVPLALVLAMAIRDPDMAAALPRTTVMLTAWNGAGLPPDAAFTAAGQELAQADAAQRIGGVAARLNFARSGMRSLLLKTAHANLFRPTRADMTALDARWGDAVTWRVMRQAVGPLTSLYLLRSLDFDLAPDGSIVALPADQAIFRRLFVRTFAIAAGVTALTLLIAYPVAYTLATLRCGWAKLALALVLIPFWTSILVRTTAWFILLQRQGPVNAALLGLGVVDRPAQLIFTRFAVIVAMLHALLPFAVMPIYAVMRRTDRLYLRAAASLGASALARFLRVYLPLTNPGVAGAALVTFMLAVGYYVTPALVGGPTDQMVSTFIASYTNESLNFGMAAALST